MFVATYHPHPTYISPTLSSRCLPRSTINISQLPLFLCVLTQINNFQGRSGYWDGMHWDEKEEFKKKELYFQQAWSRRSQLQTSCPSSRSWPACNLWDEVGVDWRSERTQDSSAFQGMWWGVEKTDWRSEGNLGGLEEWEKPAAQLKVPGLFLFLRERIARAWNIQPTIIFVYLKNAQSTTNLLLITLRTLFMQKVQGSIFRISL
jgi:hypothetical protein